MEIKVQYKSKDYWRNYFDYYFSYTPFIIYFWAFSFFGIFLSFWFLKGDFQIWHMLEVLAGAFLFYCSFGLVMSYLAVANAKRLSEGECRFVFSDEEVVVNAKSFSTKLDWTYFSRIRETRNYFIFYLKSGQRTLVPKRFFRDYEQLAEFKKLLQSKAGEKIALKKSKESLGLK